MCPTFLLCRSSTSDGAILISADGLKIPDLLKAILQLMPLDTYVFNPVTLMDMVNSDKTKGMEVRHEIIDQPVNVNFCHIMLYFRSPFGQSTRQYATRPRASPSISTSWSGSTSTSAPNRPMP